MTRQQSVILIFLALTNVLVLCGGAAVILAMTGRPTSDQPSAVAVLPSATPTNMPASPTPRIVPTYTLVNPARASDSEGNRAVLAAFDKSRAATSCRLQVDMSVSGDLSVAFPGLAPGQELPLMHMTGEFSGNDSHVAMEGYVALLLAGNAAAKIEMISVGGKNYVHGPLPLFGARQDRWYTLPGNQSAFADTSLTPAQAFSPFSSSGSYQPNFTATGSDTLDGKRCVIYNADPESATSAILGFGSGSSLSRQELQRMQSDEQGELKTWVCDDGYLHQMRMSMQGKDRSNPNRVSTLQFVIHLYDFNSKLKIAAPPNPIPAENPFLTTPSSIE